jgi:tetratricopeptide (TPR) repeat protein
MIFFRARRYDEAILAGQKALDLDPAIVNALWWQGMSYAGNGNFPKSIDCLTRAIAMNQGPVFRTLLGHVYGRSGDRPRALGILEDLTAMAKKKYVSPVNFAIVYAGLGDADATFQWLEKAFQARDSRIFELRSMYFDGLRGDARYANLMRRIGISL